MNILLFEERDVAAGHVDRVRGLEEVLAMVKENTSALAFQKAYTGEGKRSGGKCPFLPSGGDSQSSKPVGTCPWPFVWMHDPAQAWSLHPVKNVGGLLALMGLARAAWYYPRRVGLGALVTGLL